MPKGKHPTAALNAMRAAKLSEPGRYADGNGLYLIVDASGAKRWVLRTVVNRRRRDMGLGGLKTVSLAEARQLAKSYRAIARSGGDPLSNRRKGKGCHSELRTREPHSSQRLLPGWKTRNTPPRPPAGQLFGAASATRANINETRGFIF